MTIIEHVFGILAMLYCASVPLGMLAVAACMVSSIISQQEEMACRILEMEAEEKGEYDGTTTR